ncbi:hypothetical protein GCM10010399_65110 [Dactylosporangium fulvum]|uniref:CU044_5270 family protein n=1 Tax=Dactylosporangium fulvum TaxID=53359 RepID=A0ABY5VMG7_9ACTN|nr:CU044_5270 family protein [Dactylosporangium fulvum]UWP78872.1 CU044_5270 family protein [Dactylosporangium fulvum]
MFDEHGTRALLGPEDPVRNVTVPAPHASALDVIAIADSRPAPAGHRRRLVLAAAAVAVAGVAISAYVVTRPDPAPPAPQADPDPAPPAPQAVPQPALRMGPVVRPAALQYNSDPPPAGAQLRALADRLAPAPVDSTSGRYSHIRTASWNAVFDDAPGGNTQIIRPQDKEIWYAADASGRVKVTPLPPVYPNEASRQYWERKGVPGTGTGAKVDDPPAGWAGPRQPLPADPAALAKRLGTERGAQSVFFSVRDVYTVHLIPQQTRARILRILADLPGVAWRGSVTDRAGRTGVGISVDTPDARELLIFDPSTGTLLAWDEVEKPADTVAGATLILVQEHTEQLG